MGSQRLATRVRRPGAGDPTLHVVVFEPVVSVAVHDVKLLRRIAEILVGGSVGASLRMLVGRRRGVTAISAGVEGPVVSRVLRVAVARGSGGVRFGLLEILRHHHRVAARDGSQRLLLLARDLGRVGSASPLQLQVFANRVIEIAHRPTA